LRQSFVVVSVFFIKFNTIHIIIFYLNTIIIKIYIDKLVAPNIAILIAGRALQGLGSGGITALTYIIIADITPLRKRLVLKNNK